VPEDQAVNQVYYKEVLTILHEQVRRKRPKMWKTGSWILHYDNTPAHNILSVKMFLVKHKIPMLEYPPYSLDLAPCNFFFISKDQVCIERNPFQVRRCSEGKCDGGNEEAIRKGPAAMLPTVENLHGSVQGSGRGPF
jgi:hypothetical protein